MKLLNGIDFSVIILYNVILIAVGMYLAKKKIKKASDFTTAGQSLGTFTVAGSIISTCMGASILFSNYQLIHAGGIRAAITSAFWYGAWLILVLLVGRVRKTGASSIPDYISKRFSPRAQKISAWAIVLVGLSTCAAQFKSIGAMAEALNICDPTTGIILGATVIVLFTFFSGMWGSAVTNTIQSLFILAVVVLVIPLTASRAAGGLSTAMANIDPEKLSFSNSSMSMSLFFSYLVSSSLNVACEPSYSKYSLAAKDAKSAVRGQLIAWAVCTCVWLISVIPPLWINQIFPDMTDGSLFVTRLVATYMPVGLRGMVIAVRPHPIYTPPEAMRNFQGFLLEDRSISIEQSILRTKCAASLYSTVLLQALINGVPVVIDDLTAPERFAQLRSLRYIMLDKPHGLLSALLQEESPT